MISKKSRSFRIPILAPYKNPIARIPFSYLKRVSPHNIFHHPITGKPSPTEKLVLGTLYPLYFFFFYLSVCTTGSARKQYVSPERPASYRLWLSVFFDVSSGYNFVFSLWTNKKFKKVDGRFLGENRIVRKKFCVCEKCLPLIRIFDDEKS